MSKLNLKLQAPRLHILLPSDVFPPGSVGGAAWSAHTLARALIAHGHTVTAVTPEQGRSGQAMKDALGVPTLRWGYIAPRIPFVQNYFRHERLWNPLADTLVACAQEAGRDGRYPGRKTIIHAQHVQTVPAAIIAGRRLGAPVVATVRDHWPWDYFATGLHGNRTPYPRTTWASLATDLPARLGAWRGALALATIPYIMAHLRRRAAFLAQADAVIAVSHYMARRLANLVSAEKIHVIPNMVDIAAVEQSAATTPRTEVREPFLLFVGKLERNKGAGLLVDIFRALRERSAREELIGAQTSITLLVAGDGAMQAELERELLGLGVPARFLAWVDHDEVLRLMKRCTLLLFPSAWGEPLSRTPLEASALGVPTLAMPTGGTPDIISDGVNGALAATPQQFAARLATLLADPGERRRLGDNAHRIARERFAVDAVLPRVEQLYASLNG
ncbi:MAG: glycosyltransferase family 4 protein [Chloroflexales bacterium]|nr:glycosyltransferase family 4 protein [Chloroflexales bacterium]